MHVQRVKIDIVISAGNLTRMELNFYSVNTGNKCPFCTLTGILICSQVYTNLTLVHGRVNFACFMMGEL